MWAGKPLGSAHNLNLHKNLIRELKSDDFKESRVKSLLHCKPITWAPE